MYQQQITSSKSNSTREDEVKARAQRCVQSKTKAIIKQPKIFKILQQSHHQNHHCDNDVLMRKPSPMIQFSTEDASVYKQRKYHKEQKFRLSKKQANHEESSEFSSGEESMSNLMIQIKHDALSYVTPEKKSTKDLACQVVTSGQSCSTGQICSDDSKQSLGDAERPQSLSMSLAKRKAFNSQTLERFDHQQLEIQNDDAEPYVSSFNPFKFLGKRLKTSDDEISPPLQEQIQELDEDQQTLWTYLMENWNQLDLTPIFQKRISQESPESQTTSFSFVLNPEEESASNHQQGFELSPNDFLNQDEFKQFLLELSGEDQNLEELPLILTPQSAKRDSGAGFCSISRFNFAPVKIDINNLGLRTYELGLPQRISAFSDIASPMILNPNIEYSEVPSPIYFQRQVLENSTANKPSPSLSQNQQHQIHQGDGGCLTPDSQSNDVHMHLQ